MAQKPPPEETTPDDIPEGDNRREFLKKLSYVAPALITYQVGEAMGKKEKKEKKEKRKKKKKKDTSPTPDTVPLPPP